MKYRTVYLKAAKAIHARREIYSCNAVGFLSPAARARYMNTMGKETPEFGKILAIDDIEEAAGAPKPDRFSFPSDGARDFRVLLLCMMAAICENEEI